MKLKVALGVSLLLSSACREGSSRQASSAGSASAAPFMSTRSTKVPERKGMIWVPPGALIAGTPKNRLPRIADEEMPGQQFVMRGFYIDRFPFPNEAGAIPTTHVTRDEAAALCLEKKKRLCTELEWERACKGPSNRTYEYGDRYRAERCGTGEKPKLRPSGFLVGCKSQFGVSDMHGGVWEWTSSPWGRGVKHDLASLRGGNAAAGQLVGRCANAMGRSPTTKSSTIGFRCCAGEKNAAEVVLSVVKKKYFGALARWDRDTVRQVIGLLPVDVTDKLKKHGKFKVQRVWVWRPVGNEEMWFFGGCAGLARKPECGVILTRPGAKHKLIEWISSGHWAPALHVDHSPLDVWIFGGDDLGNFRRRIAYLWGKVKVNAKQRNVPRAKRPKKRR